MPIKASKILNPVGSITLTVTTFDPETGQLQEQPFTFQHKLVTAGNWVESQYEPPTANADNAAPANTETGETEDQRKEKARAEAERLRFLQSINPDELTDEQLQEVLSRVPVAQEVLDFLVGWDNVGDDDQPLPITARNLLKLDLKLLRDMASAHYKASFPNWMTSQS